MEQSDAASMGPALFIGLTVYVLATQGEPPPAPMNPSETMDMVAASTPDTILEATTLSGTPKIPAMMFAPALTPSAQLAVTVRPEAQVERVSALALALPLNPPPLLSVSAPRPPDETARLERFVPLAAPLGRPDTASELGEPAPPMGFDAPPSTQWARIAGNRVNIRSAPSLTAPVLRQLNTDARLIVLGAGETWSMVSIYDADMAQSGWVSSQYLRLD